MNREELLTLGATVLPDGRTRFRVWAPQLKCIDLVLLKPERIEPMKPLDTGYYELTLDDAPPGTRYMFRLNGQRDRPDPCSRYQPDGVHEASEVVGHDFDWTDGNFQPRALREAIFYELHIGTFTDEGTFDAAINDLDRLADLGVTHVEVMPIAAFPGARNWGYDGVLPFATQASYGGPNAFRRLVNACHERDMAVALDVVYNHLGPEGNYLREFGPYFTGKYHTPWGDAINFDGPHSDEVRRYFIENALSWVIDFHIDALRLDAVHAICDQSAYPFLHELTDRVHEVGQLLGTAVMGRRRALVIAESDLNDPRLIHPAERGGFAMDGQWADDMHHALHALLTGERNGYYEDFGSIKHLGRTLHDAYAYDGRYSAYRKCRHGAPPRYARDEKFVVCAQNHDQVGNRRDGDRLTALVSFELCKVAAGVVLLSPFTPLLFMGEEYGEDAPFLYFVSHSDPELVEAVRKGRASEFASFQWQGEVPDPQNEGTFRRSRLDRTKRRSSRGRAMEMFYRELIRLRHELQQDDLLSRARRSVKVDESSRTVLITAGGDESDSEESPLMHLCFNFHQHQQSITMPVNCREMQRVLDSKEERWCGPGADTPIVMTPGSRPQVDQPGESIVMYRAIRSSTRESS